jgi:hypothetical protein
MRRLPPALLAPVALNLLLALPGCATAPSAPPAVRYIDAHSHLLGHIPAADLIAQMRQEGLGAVAIMDPDPAKLRAITKGNAGYVVPFISLARLPEMQGLRLDAHSGEQMAELALQGQACGFGEIPTRIIPRTEPDDAATLLNAYRTQIYAKAAQLGLPVVLHVDIASDAVAQSISRIAHDNAGARIVLAHAGWSAPAARLAQLMDEHPNIYADLSVRLDPAGGLPHAPLPPGSQPPGAVNVITIIQSEGTLAPDWARLFQRHADRFFFAMDITDTERPKYIGLLLATARKALAPLGRTVERAIAGENFKTLTARCTIRPGQAE